MTSSTVNLITMRAAVCLALCGFSSSWAGSGWVGNSPMQVAFSESQGPGFINAVSSSESSESPYSSILLGKGEQRFGVEIGSYRNDYAVGKKHTGYLGLNYDIGLSDRWNLMNLTTLGVSLLPHNDSGQELVLLFGLNGGFGYGSVEGLVLGPGLGLVHAWTFGAWRWSNSLQIDSTYMSHQGWISNMITANSGMSRAISTRWAMSASLTFNDFISKESDTGSTGFFGTDQSPKAVVYPTISATRRFWQATWLSLGINAGRASGKLSDLGESINLSTRW